LAFHPQYAANHRSYVDYTDRVAIRASSSSARRTASAIPRARASCLFVDQPYDHTTAGRSSSTRRGYKGYLYVGHGGRPGSGGDPETRGRRTSRPPRQRLLPINPTRTGSPADRRLRDDGTRGAYHSTARPATSGSATSAQITGGGRLPQGPRVGVLANYGWSKFEADPCSTRGGSRTCAGRCGLAVAHVTAIAGCSITGGLRLYRGRHALVARAGTSMAILQRHVSGFKGGEGTSSASTVAAASTISPRFGEGRERCELYAASLERLACIGFATRSSLLPPALGGRTALRPRATIWTALRLGCGPGERADASDRASTRSASSRLHRQKGCRLGRHRGLLAVYLHASRWRRAHDAFFVTTTVRQDGGDRSEPTAIGFGNSAPGLFVVGGLGADHGTATPVAGPGAGSRSDTAYARRADLKLSVANGHSAWSVSITKLPSREKIAASLNFAKGSVIATDRRLHRRCEPTRETVAVISTGGSRSCMYGTPSAPTRRGLIDPPTCGASDSAIWGPAGAVVDPANGSCSLHGNAPWDARRTGGDAVLAAISADATALVGKHADQQRGAELGDVVWAPLDRRVEPRIHRPRAGRRGRFAFLRRNSMRGHGGAPRRRAEGRPDPSGTDLFPHRRLWSGIASNVPWLFAARQRRHAAWRFPQRTGLTQAWRNCHRRESRSSPAASLGPTTRAVWADERLR